MSISIKRFSMSSPLWFLNLTRKKPWFLWLGKYEIRGQESTDFDLTTSGSVNSPRWTSHHPSAAQAPREQDKKKGSLPRTRIITRSEMEWQQSMALQAHLESCKEQQECVSRPAALHFSRKRIQCVNRKGRSVWQWGWEVGGFHLLS
jgi:hypothetical protein